MKRIATMIRLLITRGGYRRAAYLKRIRYFHHQGEHCFFIPYNYGTEPYLLSFGNNVHVAAGVRFITHDVAAKMFQYMDSDERYVSRIGTITVGDNVFIGAGTTILYDVNIGNNVIVAAGALVNSDLSDGGIYGGVPARKIGNFSSYLAKNKMFNHKVTWKDDEPMKTRRLKQVRYFYPLDFE